MIGKKEREQKSKHLIRIQRRMEFKSENKKTTRNTKQKVTLSGNT